MHDSVVDIALTCTHVYTCTCMCMYMYIVYVQCSCSYSTEVLALTWGCAAVTVGFITMINVILAHDCIYLYLCYLQCTMYIYVYLYIVHCISVHVFKARHQCCVHITCNTPTLGHPSTADDAWYRQKRVLNIG